MFSQSFPAPDRLIDFHVNLSRWPFRRLPDDEPRKLVAKLRRHGVVQALASSFDGLLHRDLGAVNARLVAECEEYGEGILNPVGFVNPTLPNWESDADFCLRKSEIVGIRVAPGYHDYTLADPRFSELCRMCSSGNRLLQIVMRSEDPRTEHPRFTSKTVDPTLLAGLVETYPNLKVMLLNPGKDISVAAAAKLGKLERVYFDIGMIEGTGGVAKFVQNVGAERVLFGSALPFFYFEAALLRLHESNLGGRITQLIAYENGERLLKKDESQPEPDRNP